MLINTVFFDEEKYVVSVNPKTTRILEYCIGSDHFKVNNHPQFIQDVKSCDSNEIYTIADYYQLCGIFLGEIANIDFDVKKHPKLDDIYTYQKVVSNAVLESISLFDELKFSKSPIMLKGPSLWDSIYSQNFYHRRVTDLDVVVENREDVYTLARFLESNKFTCDDLRWEDVFGMDDEYEFPPFTRKKNVKELILDFDIPPVKFTYYSRDKSFDEVDQTIEIHKSLFVKMIGGFPNIENYCSQSLKFPIFRKLNLPANLVYLSIKFDVDKRLYEMNSVSHQKFYKLLGDLIRLLSLSTSDDIIQSIDIAQGWNVSKQYLNVLKRCSPLLPEISFKF